MIGQIPIRPRCVAGAAMIDPPKNLPHRVAEHLARLQRVVGVQHRPGVEVLVADRGGHVRVPAVHGIFRGGGGQADGYVRLDEQPEDIVPSMHPDAWSPLPAPDPKAATGFASDGSGRSRDGAHFCAASLRLTIQVVKDPLRPVEDRHSRPHSTRRALRVEIFSRIFFISFYPCWVRCLVDFPSIASLPVEFLP